MPRVATGRRTARQVEGVAAVGLIVESVEHRAVVADRVDRRELRCIEKAA